MSANRERFGGGTAVTAGIVVFLLIYLVIPVVLLLPLRVAYGRPNAWPSAAEAISDVVFRPQRLVGRKVEAYGQFLIWQDELLLQ